MNIQQFAALLINSRLSNKQEVEEIVTVFQEECRKRDAADTLEMFCDFLVSTNRITAWQCDKLREGKWKGFYLDDYVLLEWSRKDSDFAYYKARDIRDGTVVELTITPLNRTKGPSIEYKVGPYLE